MNIEFCEELPYEELPEDTELELAYFYACLDVRER